MSEELWIEARNIVQEAEKKTIPKKRKCKKAKWLSNKALQIAEKRKGTKCKADRESYRKIECRLPKNSKERQEGL